MMSTRSSSRKLQNTLFVSMDDEGVPWSLSPYKVNMGYFYVVARVGLCGATCERDLSLYSLDDRTKRLVLPRPMYVLPRPDSYCVGAREGW